MPAKLEDLITIWANTWAKEKNATGVEWVEYTYEGLEGRLAASSGARDNLLNQANIVSIHCESSSSIVPVEKSREPEEIIEIKDFSESNDSQQDYKLKESYREGFRDSSCLANSTTVNVELGTRFVGGIPIANAEVNIRAAWERTRAQEEINEITRENLAEREVTCEAGKITHVKVTRKQQNVVFEIPCKAFLTGKVVICCNHKVHTGIFTRNEQKKLAIPIQTVFEDLQRYAQTSSTLLSYTDKQIVVDGINTSNGFSLNATGVYFLFIQEARRTKYLSGEAHVTSHPISGWKATRSVPLVEPPVQVGKQVRIRNRMAIVTGTNASGCRVLSEKDDELAEKHAKQAADMANSINAASVDIDQDGGVAEGDGSKVFVCRESELSNLQMGQNPHIMMPGPSSSSQASVNDNNVSLKNATGVTGAGTKK